MADVATDLNQTIASAVNARIESEVAKAMAGDEMMGKFVAAALNQEIEVKDSRDSYRTRKTTYLRHTIENAMREATKAAVQKTISREQKKLERAVAAHLRENTDRIAEQLVGKFVETTDSPYRVNVALKFPSRD